MADASGRHRVSALAYLSLYGIWIAMLALAGAQRTWVLIGFVAVAPAGGIVVGLWQGWRSGWWGLQIHALVIVASAAFWASRSSALVLPAAAMVFVAVCVALLYWQADMRVPFFSGQPRGFRRHRRVYSSLPTTVVRNGYRVRGESFDIAEGGAYLVIDPRNFVPGQRVSVELAGRDRQPVALGARVVSPHEQGIAGKPPGVAVRFFSTSTSAAKLHRLLQKSRRHQRVLMALPIRLAHGQRGLTGHTYDVSISGCYVTAADRRLAIGDRVTVSLSIDETETLQLDAQVVWRRDTPGVGKPAGVALRFMHVTPAEAERLRSRLFDPQTPLAATFM